MRGRTVGVSLVLALGMSLSTQASFGVPGEGQQSPGAQSDHRGGWQRPVALATDEESPALASDLAGKHVVVQTDHGAWVRRLDADGRAGTRIAMFPGSQQVYAGTTAVSLEGTVWTVASVRRADAWRVEVTGIRGDGSRVAPKVLANYYSAELRMLVAPDGTPTVAWLSPDGVAVSSLRSGSWSAPFLASDGDVFFKEFDAVIDGRGVVTVAWTNHDSRRPRTRQLGPRGNWGAVEEIATAAGLQFDQLDLATNPRGDLALVWRFHDGTYSRVGGAHRAVNGNWIASASPLSGSGNSGNSATGVVLSLPYRPVTGPMVNVPAGPRVVVGIDGQAMAVWVRDPQNDQSVVVLEAARHVAGASWTAPQRLNTDDRSVYELEPLLDRRGRTTIGWRHAKAGGGSTIESVHVPTTGQALRQTLSNGGDDHGFGILEDESGTLLAGYAVDERGRNGNLTGMLRVFDTQGPSAQVTQPRARELRSRSMRVRWTGSDRWGSVVSWRIQARAAAASGAFSRWLLFTETSARFRDHQGTAGQTLCFRARGTDNVSNVGVWSAQRCVAIPVDDRALRAQGGWSSAQRPGAYLATVRTSHRQGASLSLPVGRTSRVALLADRCRDCGTVDVFIGSRRVGRVDLTGPPRRKVVIPVADLRTPRAGVLTVKVVSSGKRVTIDGVAVTRR